MNKKVLILTVVLMAVTIVTLTISEAYATKSVTVTAQRALKIPPKPIREDRLAGKSDNKFIHLVSQHTWTGDIAGICDADAVRHYHNYPDGPLWINVRAVDTFSEATVMDKTGGLTIRLDFVVDVAGTSTGTWVIIGGTGDLANLHGRGTLSGPSGAVVYSGQVHFDP